MTEEYVDRSVTYTMRDGDFHPVWGFSRTAGRVAIMRYVPACVTPSVVG